LDPTHAVLNLTRPAGPTRVARGIITANDAKAPAPLNWRVVQQMESAFDLVVDRTRARLDVPRLRTVFGVGQRPRFSGDDLSPSQAVVIERLRWNLTLFKIHFGLLLTLKGYTKGEDVLRFEAIVHNTRALHTGRLLDQFPQIVTRLAGMWTGSPACSTASTSDSYPTGSSTSSRPLRRSGRPGSAAST